MPTASGNQLLDFLIGGAAVLAMVLLALSVAEKARALWTAPAPLPISERFITHASFESFKTDLLGKVASSERQLLEKIAELRTDNHDRLMDIEKQLLSRVFELDKYTHDANHRFGNSIQSLMLDVKRLLTLEEARSTRVTQRALDRRGPASSEEEMES